MPIEIHINMFLPCENIFLYDTENMSTVCLNATLFRATVNEVHAVYKQIYFCYIEVKDLRFQQPKMVIGSYGGSDHLAVNSST